METISEDLTLKRILESGWLYLGTIAYGKLYALRFKVVGYSRKNGETMVLYNSMGKICSEPLEEAICIIEEFIHHNQYIHGDMPKGKKRYGRKILLKIKRFDVGTEIFKRFADGKIGGAPTKVNVNKIIKIMSRSVRLTKEDLEVSQPA